MKNLTLIISVFSIFTITAQNYDFGKVSKEELQEKFNPLDSSASATYLYKKRKTYFIYNQEEGFQLFTEIHERIKIYNKEGFEYATKEIRLYKDGSDKEEVKSLKAYTYNLVDGEIVKTKLKKEGSFKNELSRFYNQTKFTMPNIKEGSVIEYKYRVKSPFYSLIDEFQFQHDIPIKELEAKFEVPEYFTFKVNTKGYFTVIPKKESKGDRIIFTEKYRSEGTVTKTTFHSSNLDFTKNISIYNLSNIPALREEPHVNNINNYRSAVKYELSYTKFPNSTMKYYTTTWKDVVKTIYESSNFGGQLNKTGYFEDDVNALTASVTDPVKKTTLIFNFVKSKVNWNGYYGKYVNDGVKKAYKNQVGNVAEINLILTSMLRHAGLDANPVLVSTRGNGIPLFPTREGYDYVVSCVQLDDGMILLDATSKFSTLNVLPVRTLNWKGRIIKKNGTSTTINLSPKQKSKNTVFMFINLLENGDIKGSYRSTKTNHLALKYRERYIEADKDEFLEQLENNYGEMKITDFKVKNEKELFKPIVESYKFVMESQADVIGDKIYFEPLFFLKTKENPFKLKTREYPIDFDYPSEESYRITVNLPKEYKLEAFPESKAMKLPDDMGFFSYTVVSNTTSIQIIVKFQINQSILPSIYYEAIKEFYNQIVLKESEKVVLTKI